MNNQQRFSFQQIIGYALVAMVFVMTSCGSSSATTSTLTPTHPTPTPTPCPSLTTQSTPTPLNLGMNETITGSGRIHGLDFCPNVRSGGPPYDHENAGDIIVPPPNSLGQSLEMFFTEKTVQKIPISRLNPNDTIGFAATAETNGTLDFTEIEPPPLPNAADIITYQGQLVGVSRINVLKFTVNPLNPQLCFQFTITDKAVLQSATAIPPKYFITVQVQFYDSTGYKVLSVTKQPNSKIGSFNNSCTLS